MPSTENFLSLLFNHKQKRERKYKEPVLEYAPLATTIELPEDLPEKVLMPTPALINPHKNYQFWYKGQIHAHSDYKDDDGEHTRLEVEQAYACKGYAFISLTGHATLTPDPGVQGILHIIGAESGKSCRHHLLGIDIGTSDLDKDLVEDTCPCDKTQGRINYFQDRGGIVVLAHPRSGHKGGWWPHLLCCSGWKLGDLTGNNNYHGIEIFNRTLDSRDYWNALLCANKRVWGFGVDDFHEPLTDNHVSFNRSWIVVNSNKDKTRRRDIIENIKIGNFYTVLRSYDKPACEDTGSDGPTDDIGPALHIGISGNKIIVSTDPGTDEIRTDEITIVRGKFGSPGELNYIRIHKDPQHEYTYRLREWEDWVRFEIKQTRKNEGYLALSQPLFVT
jgi:hypothetical protein